MEPNKKKQEDGNRGEINTSTKSVCKSKSEDDVMEGNKRMRWSGDGLGFCGEDTHKQHSHEIHTASSHSMTKQVRVREAEEV